MCVQAVYIVMERGGRRKLQQPRGRKVVRPPMTGEIKYRMRHMKRSALESGGMLFSHDEVLRIIMKSFSKQLVRQCLAVRSNYPWAYRSKTEISPDVDIDEYKVLVLPAVNMYGRQTLSKIKNFILEDKYAFLDHLAHLLAPTDDGQRRIAEAIHHNNADECRTLFENLSAHVSQLMANHVDFETTKSVLVKVPELTAVVTEEPKPFTWNVPSVPNPSLFPTLEHWLRHSVNADVHFLRVLRTLPMKGNVKFITMMQGRDSILRNSVSRKVNAFRSQILLRPELLPNQVILPYTWSRHLGVDVRRLVDETSMHAIPDDCFHKLCDDECRLLLKRDPAINAASISAHDTVAFSRSDAIYVGIGELEQKNADFDGDTETCFIDRGRTAIEEIDLNMMPANNMRIFQQVRITFSEPHIMYMHQRRVSPLKFPHFGIYDALRQRLIYKWLAQDYNVELVERLNRKYGCNLYRLIEPTRAILETALNCITQIHSSSDGFDFYKHINANVLELANTKTDENGAINTSVAKTNSLYDERLPNQYYMRDNLLCDELVRVCMSGARGHLEALENLLDKLHANDDTVRLHGHSNSKFTAAGINSFQSVNQHMANKSREVQINGHNFFKSNIGYDTVSFTDNSEIKYDNQIVGRIERDFNTLLPPDIAHLITFGCIGK